MTAFISHTSIDCADAFALSTWWQDVLGYQQDPADPNLPGHEECMIISPDDSHRLLFIEVPEGKVGKNRIHLDLRPRERTRDDEVKHLLTRGATQLADHRYPGGRGWITLADPEGNEFCVLRSEAEVADQMAADGSASIDG